MSSGETSSGSGGGGGGTLGAGFGVFFFFFGAVWLMGRSDGFGEWPVLRCRVWRGCGDVEPDGCWGGGANGGTGKPWGGAWWDQMWWVG